MDSSVNGNANTETFEDTKVSEYEELIGYESQSSYHTFAEEELNQSEGRMPDVGTMAWLTVLGGFCGQFCSFGYMNVIGVFQTYYEENQLNYLSPSTISWIGSLQTFVLAIGGLFFGRIADMYGPRWLTVPGCILLTVGVSMTALCDKYYQFVLAQGLCSSLGASALFYGTTAAVTTWFSAKRGLAFGIAASGASIGGVALPFMFDVLTREQSFEIAVFAISSLLFVVSFITAAVTTFRLPPTGRKKYDFVKYYLRPYLDPVFTLVTAGLTLTYLGLFVPFAYIASHAVYYGLPIESAFRLVAYLSAGSLLGRLLSGYASDKIGKFNVFTIVIFLAGLICCPVWIFTTNEPSIILFSILYGFASGGILAMYPPVIAQVSPVSEIGTRVGAVSAVIAFGALSGNPIAGVILGSGGAENPNYVGMQIYAGVLMMMGAVVTFIAKLRYTRGDWKAIA
ncbi:major facilitator superfamily domain-containing protein [Dipodascopsis uninucleata]